MKPHLDILICTYGPEGFERIANHVHPHFPGVRYVVSAQALPADYQLPARLQESDFKIVRCEGRGLSRNRNNALRYAEGDISMIADDDLDFTTEYFENILNGFSAHPEADVIFHTYESACYPKSYPTNEFEFSQGIPKGYFVTSFEITFRTEKVKGHFQFDEDFGIGAKYPSGEEDILVYTMLRKGLKMLFLPNPIAQHDGSTTSDRVQYTPEYIRTKGAVMCRVHPHTCFLRMLTHALRHARNREARKAISPINYLRYWLEGTHK